MANALTPEEEKQLLIDRAKLINDASNSLEGYLALVDKIGKAERNLNYIVKQRLKLEGEINALEAKWGVNAANATDEIKAQLQLKKNLLIASDAIVESERENLMLLRSARDESNKLLATWKSLSAYAGKIGGQLLSQKDYLLDQQKSVKMTELSMGVLSKQAGAFRQNIYKSSRSTTALGVDTKDLAKIQGTYSDNIGRAVTLSEEQLGAVAALGAGTTLGAEGAAEFAANMENFGISAQGSAAIVQSMLETSHKMGLNSAKVIKNVQKNLGLAQKFHFKDGIAGLGRMAAMTTKFKLEMSSVAGFAEKLITPEGAVEAAAKLQVLGGAWAKMGDPFELMYRARNDIEGLTKDIIEATTQSARFNDVTGELTIDPMELHRLREVANATGMSFENLAESAKEAAKYSKIESSIGGNFSSEEKEFISSLSQYNKNTKAFEFTMLNEDGTTTTKNVKAMGGVSSSIIDGMMNQKQTLEENAKQSQTFQDTWDNLMATVKSTILPGFELFAQAITDSLVGFREWMDTNKGFDKLADFGKWVGKMGAFIVKLVSENPFLTLGAIIAGKAGVWLMNGRLLGMGFNSVASGGGAGAAGATAGGVVPTARGGFMGKVGKYGGRAGGAGMLLGAGLGMANDADVFGEKGSTGHKIAGIGSSALGMAGTGAMLGSMAGPIGTIVGGILGGIGGAAYGAYNEGMIGNNSPDKQDFISRPGENAVSFSGRDTLIGAKQGGPIDKLLNNSSGASGSGKMAIEFSRPLEIRGSIELISDGKSAKLDLNDPILMRDLSKTIQEELSRAISGGKLSSNPVRT
jgi:hypothetical protein